MATSSTADAHMRTGESTARTRACQQKEARGWGGGRRSGGRTVELTLRGADTDDSRARRERLLDNLRRGAVVPLPPPPSPCPWGGGGGRGSTRSPNERAKGLSRSLLAARQTNKSTKRARAQDAAESESMRGKEGRGQHRVRVA
eukprot:6214774-Pleurochrysis_carterae.AAC.1